MKITWITGSVAALALIAGPREAWALVAVLSVSNPSSTLGTLNDGATTSTLGGSNGNGGYVLGGNNTVTALTPSSGEIQYAFAATSPGMYGLVQPFLDSLTISGTGMNFSSSNATSSVQLDVYGFWTSTVNDTTPGSGPHYTFGPATLTGGAVTIPAWSVTTLATASGSAVGLEMLFVVTWTGVSSGDTLTFDPPPSISIQSNVLDSPEPSTLAMALTACAGVGYAGWRTRRRGRAS